MQERAASVVMTTARTGGPHLTAAGELDAAGAVRLRAQLDDALVADGPSHVSLDLSRVTHVSSDALAVLVAAYRRLREAGGSLELTEISPAVVRVLRISGLHRVLTPAGPPAAEAEEASGA